MNGIAGLPSAAKLKTIAAVLVLAGAALRPEPTIAFGGGGGDGGDGCCGTEIIFALIPNSDHEAARKLLEWLRAQEDENLKIFAAAKNPCDSMIICNGLEPAMVKALVAATIEAKRRATNKRREAEYRAETNRIALITALGTAASALIAFAALILGIRAERKNHRQETRLDNLEADRASKGGV